MTKPKAISVRITLTEPDNCQAIRLEGISPALSAFDLEVTPGPSSFSSDLGNKISLDEPFLHYFNDYFLSFVPLGTNAPPNGAVQSVQSSAEIKDDKMVEVGGLVRIVFQRTIRVIDNKEISALPPDIGSFNLYNMADLVDKLPSSVVSKGGVYINMYQREAMWMPFTSIKPCAVKVSVGGVNTLTGTPRDVSVPGKQDYLAFNCDGFSQLWLVSSFFIENLCSILHKPPSVDIDENSLHWKKIP